MNAKTLAKYESQIRQIAPSIIRVQPASGGIVISVPKPDYKNEYAGQWNTLKEAARKPIKQAVKKVLPKGTRITCFLD
jgi:hypothetical protein